MNYRDIISNICSKIGVDVPTPMELSWIKNEIILVTNDIFGLSESHKDTVSFVTSLSMIYADLPPDFYLPQEVYFYNTNRGRIQSKEIPYEQYLRWNPILTPKASTSFISDGVIDSTFGLNAANGFYDNLELSGVIGYSFFIEYDTHKLVWKPPFEGYIDLLYIKIPELFRVLLNDSPLLHKRFYKVISDGVALNWMKKELVLADTQEKLYRINGLIRIYTNDYIQGKSEIIVYANKISSTMQISPWDFLSDPSMIL